MMIRLVYILASLLICLGSIDSYSQTVRVQRSKQEITSGDGRYYMHTVARGQTLFSIAKAYDVSEQAIIEKNPFVVNGLKARQSILVPTAKTFAKWLETQKKAATVTEKAKSKTDNQDTIAHKPKKDSSKRIDTTALTDDTTKKEEVVRTGAIRSFNPNEAIEVAMILPFKNNNGSNENFTDFYKGALIALGELKSKGISVNMNLIAYPGNVSSMIERGDLDKVSLIIGPVYEESFSEVAKYAQRKHIPIVSPLASIGKVQSAYAFQAAPTEATKWDKLKFVLNAPTSKVIVLNHVSNRDAELYAEIQKILPSNTSTLSYSKDMSSSHLTDLLDRDKENVVVVPVDNESAVEEVLSRLASVNAAAKYKITVVGSSRWARFNNINFELFFKLNTMYVTNYHADRTNVAVADFYSKYIQTFDAIPTMYSMRGYDVTLLFVEALKQYGTSMLMQADKIENSPLQVKYKFRQKSDTDTFRNTEWMLVNYTPRFEIEVK